MTAPAIIARDLRIIGGGGVVAIVDVEIVPWRLIFRGCRWRKDATGESVTLGACNDAGFTDGRIAERFQQAALAAIHELAREVVAL
jgi:hypothetical protein